VLKQVKNDMKMPCMRDLVQVKNVIEKSIYEELALAGLNAYVFY